MMILKRLLGEIMTSLGFVTAEQVGKAIKKQKAMMIDPPLPEKLERVSLVSEERKKVGGFPPLGKLLMDMGFATKEQLEMALREQRSMLDIYRTLGREKLEAAIEMGSIVNSTLNFVEVLAIIMEHVNRLTGSVASTLMLRDSKSDELVFSVPTGPKANNLMDIRIPPGEGIAGWVAKNEKPLLIPDAEKDPRFYPGIDKISGLKTKSILCVPLKAKSKLIGVLEVINKKNGTQFTEEDSLLLSIFSGQAAMAIENARLYEELKAQYDEERLLQRRVTESEKLKALGQMASGVAHDFNNILSAIMGYAEIALFDLPEKNESKRSIEQVLAASHRAKDLVKQILAFSRQSDLEPRPIKISPIVNEALKLLRASIPATIEIKQNIQMESGMLLGDPTQIHRVLMNLCTNAHHALGEKGGVIEVSLTQEELGEKDVSIHLNLKPGHYMKLSVRDNGQGIDQDALERLFEPYFTTKDKGMGTGMGLAVVHGIVTGLGGAVAVKSEPGKGSCFDVILPRMDLEIESAEESFEPISTGNEHILFVDDEEALAELGKGMLERLGYHVECRTSPLDALEAFRANPHKFNIVITDMTMPNMTGDDLSKELLRIRPDIPIILCTGFSASITEKKAKAIGIREFALKPYVMRDLSKTIRKVLDDV